MTARSRRGRIRRRIAGALGVVAVAAVLLAGLCVWLLAASLPTTRGTLRLDGLRAPVEVVRDAWGIPRIRASSDADAWFALGVVHAQDRLWQMEMQRRVGAGRLSEVIGRYGLETDRFVRTLGLYRRAEADLAHLSAPVRAALDAYAAGVNAWLDDRDALLPPEFLVLAHTPEPWRPADTLVWSKLMALQLSGNWRREVLRGVLAQRIDRDGVDFLVPPRHPQRVPVAETGGAGLGGIVPPELMPRLASNVWAVDGSRTVSGAPLLANDPHLAFDNPNLWYLARIETPGRVVVGATVPGVPFVLLGRNEHVAWGFTTTESDTNDLFVERLTGDGRYDTPHGPRPFETRTERIRVRFGDDVDLVVRESRHGPVVSDLAGTSVPGLSADRVVSLQSAGLAPADRTAEAVHGFGMARDWASFEAAMRHFAAPQQNVFYADTGGLIGFVAPARVPVRRPGSGRWPAEGWTGVDDWAGFLPFADLPRIVAPASGRLLNANNPVVGPGYPHDLGDGGDLPYRARRLREMIEAVARHDVESFAAMQVDTRSLMVADFLPLLLERAGESLPADIGAALFAWPASMDAGRPEPLIVMSWLRHLAFRILGDELGPAMGRYGWQHPDVLRRILVDDRAWCDDRATAVSETCEQQVAAALDDALAGLAQRYGEAWAEWRWGDAHRLRFNHRLWSMIPFLGALATPGAAADGSAYTVNRGAFYGGDAEQPFSDRHGAGYRAVYDLAAPDRSRFVIALGQSGHPLSPHYDDLLPLWLRGDSVTIAAEASAPTHRLTLEPADAAQGAGSP